MDPEFKVLTNIKPSKLRLPIIQNRFRKLTLTSPRKGTTVPLHQTDATHRRMHTNPFGFASKMSQLKSVTTNKLMLSSSSNDTGEQQTNIINVETEPFAESLKLMDINVGEDNKVNSLQMDDVDISRKFSQDLFTPETETSTFSLPPNRVLSHDPNIEHLSERMSSISMSDDTNGRALNSLADTQPNTPTNNVIDQQPKTSAQETESDEFIHGLADTQPNTSSIMWSSVHGLADTQPNTSPIMRRSVHCLAETQQNTSSIILLTDNEEATSVSDSDVVVSVDDSEENCNVDKADDKPGSNVNDSLMTDDDNAEYVIEISSSESSEIYTEGRLTPNVSTINSRDVEISPSIAQKLNHFFENIPNFPDNHPIKIITDNSVISEINISETTVTSDNAIIDLEPKASHMNESLNRNSFDYTSQVQTSEKEDILESSDSSENIINNSEKISNREVTETYDSGAHASQEISSEIIKKTESSPLTINPIINISARVNINIQVRFNNLSITDADTDNSSEKTNSNNNTMTSTGCSENSSKQFEIEENYKMSKSNGYSAACYSDGCANISTPQSAQNESTNHSKNDSANVASETKISALTCDENQTSPTKESVISASNSLNSTPVFESNSKTSTPKSIQNQYTRLTQNEVAGVNNKEEESTALSAPKNIDQSEKSNVIGENSLNEAGVINEPNASSALSTPKHSDQSGEIDEIGEKLLNEIYGNEWKTPQMIKKCRSARKKCLTDVPKFRRSDEISSFRSPKPDYRISSDDGSGSDDSFVPSKSEQEESDGSFDDFVDKPILAEKNGLMYLDLTCDEVIEDEGHINPDASTEDLEKISNRFLKSLENNACVQTPMPPKTNVITNKTSRKLFTPNYDDLSPIKENRAVNNTPSKIKDKFVELKTPIPTFLIPPMFRHLKGISETTSISNNSSNRICGFLESLNGKYPPIYSNPDALEFRRNFGQNRDKLLQRLMELYNDKVFNNKLNNISVIWNKSLRRTAGVCKCRKRGGNRMAQIELSDKVLTEADRLRDTLIHELCHAAAWVFDGETRHGKCWKSWAAKSNKRLPELPLISICHNYEIRYKYTYKCTICGLKSQTHSKARKIENIRCAACHGAIEVFLNKRDKDGQIKLVPPKKPGGFAIFVKENYKLHKDSGSSHADIMKTLGNNFSKLTTKDKLKYNK